MKFIIFGATGNVGSRVMAEALARGHMVTAVTRNLTRFKNLPVGVTLQEGDAANADDVARLSAGHDVALSATRPADGQENELSRIARATLEGLRRSGVRLIIVGGAGSLKAPGTDTLVIDDPILVPPAWRAIAEACGDQFEVCRAETEVDWAYLSPPADLAPGERTGAYRLGSDDLLIDQEGVSRISLEDLAVALVDEAEIQRHRQARFTVAY